MGTYSFIHWIKRAWGKLNKGIHWLIFFILLWAINNFPRLFGEDIILKIILKLLGNMWKGTKPIVIEYWLTKPYIFELAILLIALFFLLLWAFIKSQPPNGIEIKWIDGMNVQVVVINSMGYKLTDCCLQITSAKTKKTDGVLYCHLFPVLPLSCEFLDEGEWEGYKLTEIGHADHMAFKVADITESPSVAKFTVWEKSISCQGLHFEGKIKLECKFMGTTPKKHVLEKNFELWLNSLGSQLKIEKVWQ